MRIHASGVGRTLDEAMVKVNAELQTAAVHAHEPVVTQLGALKVIEPERQRVPVSAAPTFDAVVRSIASGIKPAEGHLYRVLVSYNEDGVNSHAKVEVDLIRA